MRVGSGSVEPDRSDAPDLIDSMSPPGYPSARLSRSTQREIFTSGCTQGGTCSHSSQGVTADRVLVHVDTEQTHEQLINSRLAYVSISPRALRCANLYQRRREVG